MFSETQMFIQGSLVLVIQESIPQDLVTGLEILNLMAGAQQDILSFGIYTKLEINGIMT